VDDIELISYAECRDQGVSAIVVKGLDKASPALALLAVTNRVIPTATIFLSKLGDAPIDFFTAVLENVVVGTVELVEVDGGLTPTERVTLLPTRATLTYVQKPDGSPGPTSTSLITCP
jgi:type VI protein secretion system component Hcp